MALRTIIKEINYECDVRKKLTITIPDCILEDEPHTDRILHLWDSFVKNVNKLCKNRASRFLNHKRYKQTVFNSGMEKLCHDFSRRTETIKIVYIEDVEKEKSSSRCHTNIRQYPTKKKSKKEKRNGYQLKFMKLSEIPERSRNVAFCVAYIPPSEMQAYAQFVTYLPQTNTTTTTSTTTTTEGSTCTIALAQHMDYSWETPNSTSSICSNNSDNNLYQQEQQYEQQLVLEEISLDTGATSIVQDACLYYIQDNNNSTAAASGPVIHYLLDDDEYEDDPTTTNRNNQDDFIIPPERRQQQQPQNARNPQSALELQQEQEILLTTEEKQIHIKQLKNRINPPIAIAIPEAPKTISEYGDNEETHSNDNGTEEDFHLSGRRCSF